MRFKLLRQLSTETNVLVPFLLDRRLIPKVWGGRELQDRLGIPLSADGSEMIGEAWELFDRPDGSSMVRGTETSLADLVRQNPEELVGRGVPLGHGGSFPLMLKFLDARQSLSMQVHPSDSQAQGDSGKDECCLILHAGANASMVHGVRPGVGRAELLDTWDTPEVESMLYAFTPQVGDVIHIPPGTPHSIGPGVVAFEVQENSDLTYRFYDWGRGRETHAEDARDVVNMVVNERPPVHDSTSLPDGGELLLATDHFVVRRYALERRVELSTHERFLTVTVLDGKGRLNWSSGSNEGSLELDKNDTALVPAGISMVAVEPDGQMDFVVCDPGTP